jgi:serine/threonine protein kinase
MTERKVLSYVNNPFIVGLHFAFQTSTKLCLILDYCSGGDLSKHLKIEGRFSEQKAKLYLCEILLALQDLHLKDIIYRDLKPDNVVLDEDGHSKLTDFGLSKEGVMEHTSGARSFCGSIAYLAPEMLRKAGHGKAVDWYLLGVLFYEMLIGIPPYYAPSKEELFANIEHGSLKMPAGLTPSAVDLLCKVNISYPAARSRAFNSSWLRTRRRRGNKESPIFQ